MTWTLAEIEKAAIIVAWHKHSGNAVAAAKALGIGKTTIYRKLHEYGVVKSMERQQIIDEATQVLAEFKASLPEGQ